MLVSAIGEKSDKIETIATGKIIMLDTTQFVNVLLKYVIEKRTQVKNLRKSRGYILCSMIE